MVRALILEAFVILNLAGVFALARHFGGDGRLAIDVSLIEFGSDTISLDVVLEAADSTFASMDAEADEKNDIDDLRNGRNEWELRDRENVQGLLNLASERLMQAADHEADKKVSLPELRAFSLSLQRPRHRRKRNIVVARHRCRSVDTGYMGDPRVLNLVSPKICLLGPFAASKV